MKMTSCAKNLSVFHEGKFVARGIRGAVPEFNHGDPPQVAVKVAVLTSSPTIPGTYSRS